MDSEDGLTGLSSRALLLCPRLTAAPTHPMSRTRGRWGLHRVARPPELARPPRTRGPLLPARRGRLHQLEEGSRAQAPVEFTHTEAGVGLLSSAVQSPLPMPPNLPEPPRLPFLPGDGRRLQPRAGPSTFFPNRLNID